MSYYQKYLKYKLKYSSLKETLQYAGDHPNRILIFDFDNTITKIHTIGLVGPNKDLTKIDTMQKSDLLSDLFNDSNFINKLINFKNDGNNIGIASYGYKNVIKYILNKFNLTELFDDAILTPADFNLNEGYNVTKLLNGKNSIIEKFSQDWNQPDKHKIMLIDDDETNIFRAMNAGYYAIKSSTLGLKHINEIPIEQFIKGVYGPSNNCINGINVDGTCELNSKRIDLPTGEICCVKDIGYLIMNIPPENSPDYEPIRTLFENDIFKIPSKLNPNMPAHRYSWERFIWLYRWLQKDCIDQLKQNKQCKLYDNLKTFWNSKSFFPFISNPDALTIINQNKDQMLVRFSSTNPQKISVTYFNPDKNQVLNRRFSVNTDGKILFNDNKYYTFSDFILQFRAKYFNINKEIIDTMEYTII